MTNCIRTLYPALKGKPREIRSERHRSRSGGTHAWTRAFLTSAPSWTNPVSPFQIRLLVLAILLLLTDGYDTQAIGYVAPALTALWHVPRASFGPVFSVGLVGLMVGAMVFTPIADRYGPRRVLLACTVVYGLLTLCTAFAPSREVLLVLRFLTGLGLGGAMPNAIALVSEYAPTRVRTLMVAAAVCGFSLARRIRGGGEQDARRSESGQGKPGRLPRALRSGTRARPSRPIRCLGLGRQRRRRSRNPEKGRGLARPGGIPMTTRPHVLIAGGGIGGLTAALALLRRGFDVDVFEQAAELREVGAGVQVSANGSRALYALGVGDTLAASSCEASGKEIRLWSTGQAWKLFDLGAESVALYGYPYFTVYRPDLLAALIEGVRREKPDAIHLGTKVAGFRREGERVHLRLEDGSVRSGDALVGADGIHSRIRHGLFGEETAKFTGMIAWRGVIPMERLPAHLSRPVATNWVGPGRHVISYPLRRGELMNFVGIVERSDWLVESWTARGTTEDLAADFNGWHEDVQTLIQAIDTPYKWALMLRGPLPQWTRGRITLLGDACHPTLPMLAQGAVQAIEDGYVLGRALAESNGVKEGSTR